MQYLIGSIPDHCLFLTLYVLGDDASLIDSFHIVISLSNRSSIEKSIKLFLKMKGQIAY